MLYNSIRDIYSTFINTKHIPDPLQCTSYTLHAWTHNVKIHVHVYNPSCDIHVLYMTRFGGMGNSTMTNITLDATIPGSFRFARRHRCGRGGEREPCRRHRGATGCGAWARTSVQTSVWWSPRTGTSPFLPRTLPGKHGALKKWKQKKTKVNKNVIITFSKTLG